MRPKDSKALRLCEVVRIEYTGQDRGRYNMRLSQLPQPADGLASSLMVNALERVNSGVRSLALDSEQPPIVQTNWDIGFIVAHDAFPAELPRLRSLIEDSDCARLDFFQPDSPQVNLNCLFLFSLAEVAPEGS